MAGQGREDEEKVGQGRAGQGRAGQGRAGQGRAGQGRAGRATGLTSSSQTCQQSSTIRSNPNSSKQLGRVKKVSSPLTASRHSPTCHYIG